MAMFENEGRQNKETGTPGGKANAVIVLWLIFSMEIEDGEPGKNKHAACDMVNSM